MPNELLKSILALECDEYKTKLSSWLLNEKRFNAGDDVFSDLRKFNWELNNAAAYDERKDRAVFPELPSMVAEKFVGILFQKYPEEGSGLDLGNHRSSDSGVRADLLIENADGIGTDARTLFAFWFDAYCRAVATKYRWILAEAPPARPKTLQDEIGGLRPYFVEYSPTDVPYFLYDRGSLQVLIIKLTETLPTIDGDAISDQTKNYRYVMTRRGFAGFGTEEAGYDFSAGGWWIFDADEAELATLGDIPLTGSWESTEGEIPACRLFYERGHRADRRTGITQIGRIAQNFMDLFSAMMNDAWESGSGVTFLTGVNYQQWETVVAAGKDRAKWIPVPSVEGGGTVGITNIAEGTGAKVLSDALEYLLRLAMQLIARELTTSPDASGKARQVEFLQGNSPRLASMAGNIEEAMMTAHRFLEQRWGFASPAFSISWPREFDLRTVSEKVASLFELFSIVDARAPEFFTEALLSAARNEGLLPEDEERTEAIRDEIKNSLNQAVLAGQIPPATNFISRFPQRTRTSPTL